ncbi:hypothetical protein E4U41_005390 [Claviceps citrina]|nr:hypothetical protein E4U41_005390 [Claviceps citrina]
MDHRNLAPNDSRRLYTNSESSIQASPDPFMVHSYTSPISPWRAAASPLATFYYPLGQNPHGQNPQGASTVAAPVQSIQNRQHSALPHPDRSLRALQNPDSFAGPSAEPFYWPFNSQPMPGMADFASAPNVGAGMNMISSSSVSANEPGHTIFGTRGVALQPSPATDWEPTRATSNSLSMASRVLSSSGRLGNISEPVAALSSSTTLPYPPSSVSPHRSTQTPSPNSQRSQRSQASMVVEHRGSGLPSLALDRRRQASNRNRRSGSYRQSRSDPSRTQEDGTQNPSGEGNPPTVRSNRRLSLTDEMVARQMQMYRGNMSSKLVASRAAIQSLENVDICSLADNEKTCVICYNDYGMASPEGVMEVPIRLPLCKHVFGDHCIKKWLEDSDSCPYCRSKLQSEPKHLHGSARTFFNMMRLRGLPLPAGNSSFTQLELQSDGRHRTTPLVKNNAGHDSGEMVQDPRKPSLRIIELRSLTQHQKLLPDSFPYLPREL